MNKSTRQYLADVKRRLAIASNYALAKRLEISEQAVAQLTSGKYVMNNTIAAKVAEILEIPPLQVIADAEIERGSSPELWKRIRAAAAIAGAVIAGALIYGLVVRVHSGGAFDIASISGAFPMNGDALAFALGLFDGNTHCAVIALAIGAAWWLLRKRAASRLPRPAFHRRALGAGPRIAILAAAIASSRAFAGEPWPAADRALLGGALGVMVLDWAQTRDLARQAPQWNKPECADADFRAAPAIAGSPGFCELGPPRVREVNPLLSAHPSTGDVDRYFALAMLGTAGLAYALPPEYRRYFLGGVLGLEVAIVLRNHSLGLRLAF